MFRFSLECLQIPSNHRLPQIVIVVTAPVEEATIKKLDVVVRIKLRICINPNPHISNTNSQPILIEEVVGF